MNRQSVYAPRANVAAAVWLQVRKTIGWQVEVRKDLFLHQVSIITNYYDIYLLCFTRLVFPIDQLYSFPVESEVPVRVSDHRQLLAFVRDDLKVPALRVEVYAGEGFDLAVPLD